MASLYISSDFVRVFNRLISAAVWAKKFVGGEVAFPIPLVPVAAKRGLFDVEAAFPMPFVPVVIVAECVFDALFTEPPTSAEEAFPVAFVPVEALTGELLSVGVAYLFVPVGALGGLLDVEAVFPMPFVPVVALVEGVFDVVVTAVPAGVEVSFPIPFVPVVPLTGELFDVVFEDLLAVVCNAPLICASDPESAVALWAGPEAIIVDRLSYHRQARRPQYVPTLAVYPPVGSYQLCHSQEAPAPEGGLTV